LHAFVDTITGDSYSIADVSKAVNELPRPSKKEAADSDETHWIAEGAELAKTRIYTGPIGVGASSYAIDEVYQRAVLNLARSRISLAGVRLARLLNEAFASEAKAKAKAKAKQNTPTGAAHETAAKSGKPVGGNQSEAQVSVRK
jgi:hypothetical protein